MKKYILPLLLAFSLVMPVSMAAEPRGNNNRQNNERSVNHHRQGAANSSRPGGNPGASRPNNNNRPANNNGNRPNGNNSHSNPRPGNQKGDKMGHDKNQGSHGNPQWSGNSHNRPGGNHSKPNPAHKPPVPAPSRPGGNHGWRPGSSAMAPGHGHHNHPPRLGYMVNHAMRGGRYDNVWMVAPGQYAVRYLLNGLYYMQYIWPETGVYGAPFRVVQAAPGQWYAYGNRNQWYYDDGPSLRISLNGTPQNPWTLVPSIELNINL